MPAERAEPGLPEVLTTDRIGELSRAPDVCVTSNPLQRDCTEIEALFELYQAQAAASDEARRSSRAVGFGVLGKKLIIWSASGGPDPDLRRGRAVWVPDASVDEPNFELWCTLVLARLTRVIVEPMGPVRLPSLALASMLDVGPLSLEDLIDGSFVVSPYPPAAPSSPQLRAVLRNQDDLNGMRRSITCDAVGFTSRGSENWAASWRTLATRPRSTEHRKGLWRLWKLRLQQDQDLRRLLEAAATGFREQGLDAITCDGDAIFVLSTDVRAAQGVCDRTSDRASSPYRLLARPSAERRR